MKKELTITEIENLLICLEEQLSYPQAMDIWVLIVSQYHALHIKLANMKGEHVSAEYSKSDYII